MMFRKRKEREREIKKERKRNNFVFYVAFYGR